MKLHIGCGREIKKGFVNIDRTKSKGINLVLNVGKEKLPFEDSSVDFVLANHFIEHLDTDETTFMLDELYRVCKLNAIIEFVAPHYLSPTSCRPWHKQRISETYFNDYEIMDKICSLDHKFYFKVKSWTKCLNGFPDTVHFELEVKK